MLANRVIAPINATINPIMPRKFALLSLQPMLLIGVGKKRLQVLEINPNPMNTAGIPRRKPNATSTVSLFLLRMSWFDL